MTIAEAIEKLKRLGRTYGEATDVYFDCPSCRQSFTPNTLTPVQAIHLSGTTPKEKKP